MVSKGLARVVMLLLAVMGMQASIPEFGFAESGPAARQPLYNEACTARCVVLAEYTSARSEHCPKIRQAIENHTAINRDDLALLCDFHVLKVLKQPAGSNIEPNVRMWLLWADDDCMGHYIYQSSKLPSKNSQWILIISDDKKDQAGALLGVRRAQFTPKAMAEAQRAVKLGKSSGPDPTDPPQIYYEGFGH